MNYYHRLQLERLRQDMDRRTHRRADLIDKYADFHDRQWLESMTYTELVLALRTGRLDRPTLPIDNQERTW